MIDHICLNVRDAEASRKFYEPALAPLGYSVTHSFPEFIGLGAKGKPDFWIGRRDPVSQGVHFAFLAPDRKTVDAFYAAALQAGGRDNGPPGPRPQYHEHYYGAFVLDPDGNNVEAVCHKPES